MKMIKDELKFRTIRVSQKGQITIPSDIQKEIGIRKGDELLLIKKGRKMMLEKPERIIKTKDEFREMSIFSEHHLKRLWLNKEDEIWNEYLKSGKK